LVGLAVGAFGLVAALAVMGAALLLLQVMPESDQPWGDLGQISWAFSWQASPA